MPVSLGPMLSRFVFDPSRAERQICGLRAHAVLEVSRPERRLVALEAAPGRPPRTIPAGERGLAVPHAMMPVQCGPGLDSQGKPVWLMVCAEPSGSPLALTGWSEAALLESVLRPAAEALQGFAELGWTHRAIRPDNLFRAASGGPVTLGPGWATPPAFGQPALFEPPYVGACRPELRGAGRIADDVYALGVTLLALALGREPLAGLSDAAVVRRKLELGSFAALSTEAKLSPSLADLLRAMLAEDPDHRPAPAALREMRLGRTPPRPAVRAQRGFEFGTDRAFSARELAHLLGGDPDRAAVPLRNGTVARWVRVGLADPRLAIRLEEQVASVDADAGAPLLVLRAVAALDRLAPLRWRGEAMFPDGIGPGLAMASTAAAASSGGAALTALLAEVVRQEAAAAWHAARGEMDAAPRLTARTWRGWLAARGAAGGVRRLLYELNPCMACASPRLGAEIAVRAADLLPALERAAASADQSQIPFDADLAAFLAARSEASLQAEIAKLPSLTAETGGVLLLFAQLQARFHPEPLPGLATWLLQSDAAGLARFAHRPAREALRQQLAGLAAAGQIEAMAAVAGDTAARRSDAAGLAVAAARRRAIDAELAQLTAAEAGFELAATRLGREAAAALGVCGSFVAALLAALG